MIYYYIDLSLCCLIAIRFNCYWLQKIVWKSKLSPKLSHNKISMDSCCTVWKETAIDRLLYCARGWQVIYIDPKSNKKITLNLKIRWFNLYMFPKLWLNRFFTKDSLVADQDYGPILSSLLVGPCALEFTKVKPTPNNW